MSLTDEQVLAQVLPPVTATRTRHTKGDAVAEAVFRLAGQLTSADQTLTRAAAALRRGDLAGGSVLVEQARRELHEPQRSTDR